MLRRRVTIASLLVVILSLAVVFAGLRSGSNDWFKSIYTLTFLMLAYSAIAARYRGPFWYGFAVAGWAYFVIAFGPWIGSPPGSEPLRAVNRNIVTSVVLEIVSGTLSWRDGPTTDAYRVPIPGGRAYQDMLRANRDGVCHCGLTILFALAGGRVSAAMARSSSRRAGSANADDTSE